MCAGSEALACSLSLLIGLCFLISNFESDLKENVKQLNDTQTLAKKGKLSAYESIKAKRQLTETIKF